jgi:hypothetical protein
MKMKKLILACVTLLLLATSCDGNKNEQKETLETDLKNVINEHAKVADDFIGKLDELLTLEMAAAASGYPAAEAKKRPDSEAEKKINKISISYTWQKTNRTKVVEVMGRKIDAPRPDVVELSWVKNTTLEGFKKENHNPTADELAQTSAESIDDKDSRTECSREKQLKMRQTEAAEINRKRSHEIILVWKKLPALVITQFLQTQNLQAMPIRELVVYYNGLSFTLMVDLSDDAKINDEKAIALAKQIIKEKLQ